MESGPNVDTWSVSYNRSSNTAGGYVIRVNVCKWIMGMFCTYDYSSGTFFYITGKVLAIWINLFKNFDFVYNQINTLKCSVKFKLM